MDNKKDTRSSFFKRPSDAESAEDNNSGAQRNTAPVSSRDSSSEESSASSRDSSEEGSSRGASEARPRRAAAPTGFDTSDFKEDSSAEGGDRSAVRKPLARRPYERKPFGSGDVSERRSYDRGGSSERRPYDRGEGSSERRPYDRGEGSSERRPYDRGEGSSERRPYDRGDSFERRPYDRGAGSSDRGFNKPYGDRKPFAGPRRDDKPGYEPREEKAPPENLIFGIHPVREALESGGNIEKIYVKRGVESAEGIVEYAHARGIQVQEVPLEKLDRLTRRAAHQGVVAVVPPIEYADFNELLEKVIASDRPALFVVLDGVTDVRNFGAIARTAECAGADGLIVSAKSSAPVNAEAIKSSAGALGQIPVCRVGSLRNTLKSLQIAGVRLVAATEKTTDLIYESTLTGAVAVVMGAEGTGVSVELLKLCDQKVGIPMLGKIESLNVSAAAAVVLYEVVRQRFNEE